MDNCQQHKKTRFGVKDLILCALFAALVAVGAFIKIPIPYVPVTLQTFFVTLAGMLLGAKRGAISVSVYVALGLLGVPVFTGGGGIGYVLRPTFGYIIGFFVGAFVVGLISYRKGCRPTFRRLLFASFAGLGVIYLFGVAYYWIISTFYTGTPIGLWPLFLHCFLLTIPGDIALCFPAALISVKLIPHMD